jgi:hypothetical protein
MPNCFLIDLFQYAGLIVSGLSRRVLIQGRLRWSSVASKSGIKPFTFES